MNRSKKSRSVPGSCVDMSTLESLWQGTGSASMQMRLHMVSELSSCPSSSCFCTVAGDSARRGSDAKQMLRTCRCCSILPEESEATSVALLQLQVATATATRRFHREPQGKTCDTLATPPSPPFIATYPVALCAGQALPWQCANHRTNHAADYSPRPCRTKTSRAA